MPVSPNPLETRQDGFHHDLGRKLKQERIRRGLTLKEVESRVGISATHLSEVERGKSSPTVGVLEKIARALGTRSSLLIDLAGGPLYSVTHPEGRRVLLSPGGAVCDECLSDSFPGAEMTMLLKTISPVSGRALCLRAHEGEELVTVLEGRARLVLGSEEYLLAEGDSIHFRATRPHAFDAPGPERAVLLLGLSPRYAL